MKRYKYSIWLIVSMGVLGSSSLSVFWYFEDRLLCEVQDNNIQVSIDTQASSEMQTYCFTILQRLAQKIAPLESDIGRAKRYSTQWSVDDRAYWKWVIIALEETVLPYRTLRDLITSSMSDYENELFFSVKNLVKTYLRDEYIRIDQRLQQAYILKERIVSLWNNQQFDFVKSKIEEWETQRMVLLTVRNSSSFDALIPALKSYFGLQQTLPDQL